MVLPKASAEHIAESVTDRSRGQTYSFTVRKLVSTSRCAMEVRLSSDYYTISAFAEYKWL